MKIYYTNVNPTDTNHVLTEFLYKNWYLLPLDKLKY